MDEIKQFVVAEALLQQWGGPREAAWTVAGEVLAEGQSLQAAFLKVSSSALNDRLDAVS